MKKPVQILAIAFLLSGCTKDYTYKSKSSDSESMIELAKPVALEADASIRKNSGPAESESTPPSGDLSLSHVHEVDKKTPSQIIRNANIRFQVKDVEKSHQKISELLKQNNSYFGSDNKETNSYTVNDNMVIRIPADNFDKLMNAIMEESVYTNFKNITAEDVTAEFVDIESRLKNKKEVEQRYIALLKQANKVADILEVEDKLRVIREEIESSEGRLKLMKDQVAYSTITLNIYQKLDYAPEPETGFLSNLREAFISGWRGLIRFVVFLVRIWPFVIIIFSLIFLFIKRVGWKKIKA